MKKVVLVLGRGFSTSFEKHVLAINPSFTVIECDHSEELPSENANQYFVLPKGKELVTIKKFLSDKTLVAVINRKDYLEKLHGQLVDYYQISGPSSHAIDQISNKANFHKLMLDLDLGMFRPRAISCPLSEVPRLLKSSQFPVIIKPFAGAHSRGVFKLERAEDFEDVYPLLYQHFKKEPAVNILGHDDSIVLIEEFLDGRQVAPICYVDAKSKVHFVSLVKVVTARDLKLNHSQCIYRTTPSNIKESLQQKMRFVLQKISRATMLTETFLDPEFFINKDQVYLIEVNVRMGGFRQELAKPAFNIDLNRMITQLALHQEVDDQINHIKSATACEIWSSESGTIKTIKLPKSRHITSSKINLNPGDEYIAPPIGNKSMGNFYVSADEHSLKIAKKIRAKMVIEFE